jgi:hypothetical protein
MTSVGSLAPGASEIQFVDIGLDLWNPLGPLDSSLVDRTLRLVITLRPEVFIDEPGSDSAFAPRYLPFRTVLPEVDEVGATAMYLRTWRMPAREDTPSTEPLWRQFLAQYPNSRLVEGVLHELNYLAGRGLLANRTPLQGVLSVMNEAIQRRPESPVMIAMIKGLGRGPGFTTADFDSLMHEIAARRPDSPALEALKAIR